MVHVLKTLRDTRSLARRIARRLAGREVLLLSGDLGTGKTTFVRYLAEALGIDPDWVSSPSFTLVQRYPAGGAGIAVTHVDLYRLGGGSDLETLGLDDALASDDLLAVEWPEAARDIWAACGRPLVRLRFEVDGAGVRSVLLEDGEGSGRVTPG